MNAQLIQLASLSLAEPSFICHVYMTIISTRTDFTTTTWKETTADCWKLAYFSTNKRRLKKQFQLLFCRLRSWGKDNTVPASPSQCGLHCSVFTNRPSYLKPSDAVISPDRAQKQIRPFKRHACYEDDYKTHYSLFWRQRPGAWNGWIWAVHAFYEVRPCCTTLVEQGYRKGEGQLPKRVWECVYVCLCMGSITT